MNRTLPMMEEFSDNEGLISRVKRAFSTRTHMQEVLFERARTFRFSSQADRTNFCSKLLKRKKRNTENAVYHYEKAVDKLNREFDISYIIKTLRYLRNFVKLQMSKEKRSLLKM